MNLICNKKKNPAQISQWVTIGKIGKKSELYHIRGGGTRGLIHEKCTKHLDFD